MKTLYRSMMLGFFRDGDHLTLVVPEDAHVLVAKSLAVQPLGYAIESMAFVESGRTISHDGLDLVGEEADVESWRRHEHVDEDDPRWENEDFQPPIKDGWWELAEHNVLPLLHAGDRLVLFLRWRGVGSPPPAQAALMADSYLPESEIQPHELAFDSGRQLDPGEEFDLRVRSDRLLKPERLWIAGGSRRAESFIISDIKIGNCTQLMSPLAAHFFSMAPRVMPDVAQAGVDVRIQGAFMPPTHNGAPKRLRMKLIGVTRAEGAARPDPMLDPKMRARMSALLGKMKGKPS